MKAQVLKIIPHYTGCRTLEQAVNSPEAHKILPFEILLNETVGWERLRRRRVIREAYRRAAGWYRLYKTGVTGRGLREAPLQTKDAVTPDEGDVRLFWETVTFAERQSR